PEFIRLLPGKVGGAGVAHSSPALVDRPVPRPNHDRGKGVRMSQKAVELILMRQLASSLAMPIFLVDPGGNLLFYNEPAEQLLGSRYDETGEMSVGQWSSLFTPIGEDGAPLPGEALPLDIALHKHRAAHLAFWI